MSEHTVSRSIMKLLSRHAAEAGNNFMIDVRGGVERGEVPA
ncbi:hypothetical protein ACFFMR_19170 [Micromonospora andamanensis]|nr:hypothetical protein [Micromonospora andamanensis]